jgi:acetate kinase
MGTADSRKVLTLNSGSSSLKFALFLMGPEETMALAGKLDRIGLGEGEFRCKDAAGQELAAQKLRLANHDAALGVLFDWLRQQPVGKDLDAVGHRVVHGGRRYSQPQRITSEVLAELHRLTPLAPNHLPSEIKAIEAVSRAHPSLPQVACFDTAFHRQMPAVAQHFALPRHLTEEGILRYGFHGLSYEYVVGALEERERRGRVIIAHLGNGASMAAVRDGRGVDTTMGLTPTGGLVMGTRSGDLDPGVLLHLMREEGIRPASLDELLNHHAGLLGISGLSPDMKDLLERAPNHPHAAEAVELFCYVARKFIGAFTAVLGGLDTLVFTGGIGENAAPVRARIGAGLEFLGVHIDPERNQASAPVISPDRSPVTVRVVRTNEELMIARHTQRLIGQSV